MREYEQEVREQYEIEIKSTRRTRGAFFCIGNADTEVFLMKETLASEKRAALLYLILNRLEKTGKLKVDAPVFSRDGKLIVAARDGTRYMMKKWYSGRECDMKKEQELLLAAEKLGILHTHLKWQEPTAGELETLRCKYAVRSEDAAVSESGAVSENAAVSESGAVSENAAVSGNGAVSEKKEKEPVPQQQFPEEEFQVCPPAARSPLDEMLRHNREMKKVCSFIRKRVVKNEFEALYLKHFEAMYEKACAITAAMEQSGCMQIYEKNVAENRMMHGDYNYHNILILPGDTAITNFEHMRIGIQVQDLYYFLRKAMEKYRWKQKLGVGIIRAYERQRRLEPGEWEYLGLQLAYPEKFWKTASSYCRSNKAWLPEKSVEKLELAVNQEEEKTNFLKTIFGIHL
ncbi:MarR family transcriptional regulator [[Ruminococcus] lactaris]|uniref:MarR family transcriptional regulator n=1 Tax=[Ruminococcus] lactaris TaxID=46228 RepID=UPI001D048BA1|nr:MarR family transcriptional regulator [[Ruminococcus] lactaris]MCB5442518.1 MarR family transcriptional regulator [[Ruminococcus] lactaris]MCB5532527.1 MarR family transcriptional regulator [[Ruminococcus] lactaris]